MQPRFIKSTEHILRDIKKAFIQITIITAVVTAFAVTIPFALDGVRQLALLISS
jgi:hypothetical protein